MNNDEWMNRGKSTATLPYWTPMAMTVSSIHAKVCSFFTCSNGIKESVKVFVFLKEFVQIIHPTTGAASVDVTNTYSQEYTLEA